MQYTIFCYGYGDAIFGVLNALAMLFEHELMTIIRSTVVLISVSLICINIVQKGLISLGDNVPKLIWIIMLMQFGFAVKGDMIIYDHITKQKELVSNLPAIFVLPIGTIEVVGEALAEVTEQALTVVGSSDYRNYGTVFGAKLIREAREWRIRNPEFALNMYTFINDCAIRDAEIGANYTVEQLLATDDVWGLVKGKAGTLRKIIYRSSHANQNQAQTKELLTCKEAAQNLETAFTDEWTLFNQRYVNSIFGQATDSITAIQVISDPVKNPTTVDTGKISKYLKNNITKVFGDYFGNGTEATTILRQHMMIHAFHETANMYGQVRSQMQQETAWQLASTWWKKALPQFQVFAKCMIYFLFIFVAIAMFIQGAVYKKYLLTCISIQLWPMLNAVLNMAVEKYTHKSLAGAGNIVSFSTLSEMGNVADSIVSIAEYFEAAIPFLAYSIVFGGGQALVNKIDGALASIQSPAGFLSSELVTNNRQLDNVSIGNQQFATQSGFKTDFDSSYLEGGHTSRYEDGTMQRITSGGNTILQSGAGITASSGTVQERSRTSDSNQIAQNLSDTKGLITAEEVAFETLENNTRVLGAQFLENLTKHTTDSSKLNYDTLGELSQSAQDLVSDYTNKSKTYSYAENQNTGFSARGNVGLNFGNLAKERSSIPQQTADNNSALAPTIPELPNANPLDVTNLKKQPGRGGLAGIAQMIDNSLAKFPISVGINTDVDYGANKGNSQDLRDEHSMQNHIQNTDNYNKVMRGLASDEFLEANGIDKSLGKEMREHYNKMDQLSERLTKHRDQAEHYSEALNHSHAKEYASDVDQYHHLEQATAKRYGVSQKTAHDMIEHNDPRVNSVRSSLNHQQQPMRQISEGKLKFSDTFLKENLEHFKNEHQSKINRNPMQGKVIQHAKNKGFDFNDNRFVNKKADLETRVNDIIHKSESKIHTRKEDLANKQAIRQQQINEADEKRVGGLIGLAPKNPSTVQKAKNDTVKG